MHHDKNDLLRALRTLDRQNGDMVMTVIVVRRDDPFDFASLGTCPDCGLPGLPHGQVSDWRVADDGGQGLHGYVFADRVEFHLDVVDACRDPFGHVVNDTRAVGGALIGALVGVLVAALEGDSSRAVAHAAVGAIGGGLAGACIPARRTRKIEFRDLLAASTTRRAPGMSAIPEVSNSKRPLGSPSPLS